MVLVNSGAAQQIVGRESRCIGMFRKIIGPAMLALIRAAASTQMLGYSTLGFLIAL